MAHWQTQRFRVDVTVPKVMGIVNITPDSFSDGGYFDTPRLALAYCEHLIREGADLLDLGAESTRPGAKRLSLDEELARLMPVLTDALSLGVPISVDTYKPEVMRQALAMGADAINDVWSLRQPGAVKAVADHPGAGAILMHMHGEPATMQQSPMAGDVLSVVEGVSAFLGQRVQAALDAGVQRGCLVLDPGVGFGKTVGQNFALLKHLGDLNSFGLPLGCGWSRKSSLGEVTGRAVGDRQFASVTAATLAMDRGARILRVHDVPATVDAVKVWQAMTMQA